MKNMNWTKETSLTQQGAKAEEIWIRKENGEREEFKMDLKLGKKTNLISLKKNIIETISKQLRAYFGLDFEVDHAIALLNQTQPGIHHPDNFQLLLKAHNSKKSNNNWDRFTLNEQIEYILAAIKLQDLVASRFHIDMENTVFDSLIERLKSVY